MFLLNSCLGLFSAARSLWHPFSRSYGVILPSSLTMLLPSALGSSPYLPVSVYGTGPLTTIAVFLGGVFSSFATLFRCASHLQIIKGDLPPFLCLCLHPHSITGFAYLTASPQFCANGAQESQPVLHRLRLSASAWVPAYPGKISFTLETLDIRP